MPISKRWTIKVPQEKIDPAGSSDALAVAKEELAPFETKHSEQGICRCEKCADKKIRQLATRFNKLRFAANGAPRAKDVPQKLDGLARKCRELAATFSSLDDYCRHWLLTRRKPVAGEPDGRDLYKKAGAKDLPPPSLTDPGDGKFVERLIALDMYVRLMSERFEIWRLWNAPYPITDKGGNTNMFTQWYGTPNKRLVVGAFHLYEDFKPGAVRNTEFGSFHRFANAVFLYATGSRKGQSSLYPHIKGLLGRDGMLKASSSNKPR
jgi:hypothetical protein